MNGFSIRLTHKIMAIGLVGLMGLPAFGAIYKAGSWSQDASRVVAVEGRAVSNLNKQLSIKMLEARRAEKDFQLRRVYLNQPHSKNPRPSWYGESVGHYENGDTLVVDTIGLNDRTYVDNYRTPHTTALHVVERFRLTDGGQGLEVIARVEDPGAFTMPWTAVQRYRIDHRPSEVHLHEMVCAENNEDHFNQGLAPIPQAKTPDF